MSHQTQNHGGSFVRSDRPPSSLLTVSYTDRAAGQLVFCAPLSIEALWQPCFHDWKDPVHLVLEGNARIRTNCFSRRWALSSVACTNPRDWFRRVGS
jgi:hypothetical protein